MKTIKEIIGEEKYMCRFQLHPEHCPDKRENCYTCSPDDKNQRCECYQRILMPDIIKRLLERK